MIFGSLWLILLDFIPCAFPLCSFCFLFFYCINHSHKYDNTQLSTESYYQILKPRSGLDDPSVQLYNNYTTLVLQFVPSLKDIFVETKCTTWKFGEKYILLLGIVFELPELTNVQFLYFLTPQIWCKTYLLVQVLYCCWLYASHLLIRCLFLKFLFWQRQYIMAVHSKLIITD